nr:MAG TPA: hypothetical protein [Caudoviricetes sp.]DAM42245.1 MAG TPA: hypothetical protein [Caudoviricetes sp.]
MSAPTFPRGRVSLAFVCMGRYPCFALLFFLYIFGG